MPDSETANHHFGSIADAKTFALAGNAILTLESLKSGQHYTFKVREKAEAGRETVHFVHLLASGNDYTYLGIIRTGRFMLTKASKANKQSGYFKAFDFFWNRVQGDEIPAQLVIRHAGRCGRCGRMLTTPESLDSGFGSECRELMGLDL